MNRYVILIYNNIYLLYTFMYSIVMCHIFYKIRVITVFIGATIPERHKLSTRKKKKNSQLGNP